MSPHTMSPPSRLYHGTSAYLLPEIRKRGLLPRGKKPAVDRVFSSNKNAVYLTDSFAIKFALDACARGPKPWRLLVIEVSTAQLEPSLLTVDDDALAHQLSREGIRMRSAVRLAQKRLISYASPDNAARSLASSGS